VRFPPAPCPCVSEPSQRCAAANADVVTELSLYRAVAAQTHVCVSSLAVCHGAGHFWDWVSASWSQLFGESLSSGGRKGHLFTRAESSGFSNCLNLFSLFEHSVFLLISNGSSSLAVMCIYPNHPGAITHPFSVMLACNFRLTATTTPRRAALTSQEPWMTFP